MMRRWLIALAILCIATTSLASLRLPFKHGDMPPGWYQLDLKRKGGLGLGRPVKMASTTNPTFVWFQSDGEYSVLTQPLGYKIEMTFEEFQVPAGFVTDYASVPQPLQWLVPKIGSHSVPAVIHDYLYWDQTCSREEADKIMYAAMEEYGAGLPARLLVYLGLRVGAWWAWSDSAEEKANGVARFVPAPAPLQTTSVTPNCPANTPANWIPVNITWAQYRKSLPPQSGPPIGTQSFEPVVCKLPETTLFHRYWNTVFP